MSLTYPGQKFLLGRGVKMRSKSWIANELRITVNSHSTFTRFQSLRVLNCAQSEILLLHARKQMERWKPCKRWMGIDCKCRADSFNGVSSLNAIRLSSNLGSANCPASLLAEGYPAEHHFIPHKTLFPPGKHRPRIFSRRNLKVQYFESQHSSSSWVSLC